MYLFNKIKEKNIFTYILRLGFYLLSFKYFFIICFFIHIFIFIIYC